VLKLPPVVQIAWRKYVCTLEEQNGDVTFCSLVDFIDKQVRTAKHPVFSAEALQEADSKTKHSSSTVGTSGRGKTLYATNVDADVDNSHSATVATQVATSVVCPLCAGCHDLDDCAQY